MRAISLGVALLPYLSAVAVDAWMHERAREVPRREQVLHALAAVFMLSFLAAAFLGRAVIAVFALLLLLPTMLADELGFHRYVARAERRVHILSYIAFAGFVATWLWWRPWK